MSPNVDGMKKKKQQQKKTKHERFGTIKKIRSFMNIKSKRKERKTDERNERKKTKEPTHTHTHTHKNETKDERPVLRVGHGQTTTESVPFTVVAVVAIVVYRVLLGFYRVSPGLTWFYWVFTEFD